MNLELSGMIGFLCAFVFAFPLFFGQASVAEPKAPQKLRVVARVVEPFVLEKDGKLAGYSVDLWQAVAEKAGFQFEYQTVNTVPEILAALRDGKADVAVGALTITEEREKTIDFSYPIYHSGLKIAVLNDKGRNFYLVFEISLGVMLVVAFLFWKFGSEKNQASNSPGKLGGRILFTLVAVVLVSVAVAVIAGTLPLKRNAADIKGVSDLPGRLVGTLPGTSAAENLVQTGVQPKYYPDLRSAVLALEKGELEAVVYDAPMLTWLADETKGRIEVLPALFDRQAYGFGMKDSSGDLRSKVNLALQALTDAGVLDQLDKKWFGSPK